MTGQLTPTITWHYWDGDSWEDISEYVLDDTCQGGWGMSSNRPLDRLATTGEMSFDANNSGGLFDPDNANVLTGWALNTKVKMTVTYSGYSKIAFYGHVTDIQITDNTTTYSVASVAVLDWLDYAYRYTITQQSIETYKRGDQVVDTIVNAVGQTPIETEYNQGDNVFPAAFDSMTVKTKAATELNKIVLSEGGYFYVKHDRVNGETLVFEGESVRNGLHPVSQIPVLSTDTLLKANSATDHILMAGSATDKLIFNQGTDAHMNGIAERYERVHGENIINRITVTAYPKRTDTTEQTLYSLGDVIKIASGETKEITVKYQNATTKEDCNAITSLMVPPVATTDYTMNTKRDGTGTNLTANLAVTVVFYTAEAKITLVNSSAYTGKIAKLNLRGYGIYQDSEVKATVENTTSQGLYSEHEMNIEQQYQRDTITGQAWAERIITDEAYPRTKLERVAFCANKTETRMLAFLAIDVGDMVKITESSLNIDGYYYINGVEFEINAGDVINYAWVLAEAVNFSAVELELTDNDTDGQYIDYPSIAELRNPEELTICADINVSADMIAAGEYISTRAINTATSEFSGWGAGVDSDNKLYLNVFRDAIRDKILTNAAINNATWYRVGVRMNNDGLVKEGDVIISGGSIFIDGTEAAATYTQTAVKAVLDDGNHIKLGVAFNMVGYGFFPFWGSVKNVYVYNTYLTDAELAADAASPGSVTRGLQFAAPFVNTRDLADYDNLTLTADNRIYDKVKLLSGTPVNSPVTQLIP